jgi:hypothetical protein
MIEKTKRRTRMKNVLLLLLAVGIVGSLLTPAVLAAAKDPSQSGDKQATVFDPFAMRAVVLTGDGDAVDAQTELKLTRRSIRVPFRPGLRSAYRPVW